jgi:hypothetical protein
MNNTSLHILMLLLISITNSFAFANEINSSNENASDGFEQMGEIDWGDEEDTWGSDESSNVNIGGFVEYARGRFNHSSINKDRSSLNEARARLELDTYINKHFLSFKADMLNDNDLDEQSFDVREAFLFTRYSKYDFRFGRQALTWGTGDLVFLNDLFPKDWQSFFAGREISYLKAPVDAFRVSRYSEMVNLDIAFLAPVQSDRYLTGERFSFYNPSTSSLFIAPPKLTAEPPTESADNTEVALRVFKTIKKAEVAAYFHKGFYKQPVAFDPIAGVNYFPKLEAIGASVLRPSFGGITKSEFTYHHSVDDPDGDSPFIKNSEMRFLVGHERELISKLTASFQYYLEWTQDYDQLIANSFTPLSEQSERRHTLTLRLLYMTMQDKLRLSWFSYYSPDENDSWLLPSIQYQMNDQLSFETGANIFKGKKLSSFLGQFEENDNYYLRARLSF